MRYLPPFEETLRAQICNEMTMTPLITVMGIKARLEKHFDRGLYIRKLIGKVRNEFSYQIDTAKIATAGKLPLDARAAHEHCWAEGRTRRQAAGQPRRERGRREHRHHDSAILQA